MSQFCTIPFRCKENKKLTSLSCVFMVKQLGNTIDLEKRLIQSLDKVLKITFQSSISTKQNLVRKSYRMKVSFSHEMLRTVGQALLCCTSSKGLLPGGSELFHLDSFERAIFFAPEWNCAGSQPSCSVQY